MPIGLFDGSATLGASILLAFEKVSALSEGRSVINSSQ
jgi:hypothetical protein